MKIGNLLFNPPVDYTSSNGCCDLFSWTFNMESKLIGVPRVGAFGDDYLIFESNQKIPNCHIHHLG
jgi:hypothetical protein